MCLDVEQPVGTLVTAQGDVAQMRQMTVGRRTKASPNNNCVTVVALA
jgi:hypothetical protein